jgi:hypothetical protein
VVIEMKLKYYMRGLGIGILITTIVLSIGGKKEKITDEEIMARAKELGMVMTKDDTDDNLEEVLEKSLGKPDSETDEVENNKDVNEQVDTNEQADADEQIDVDEPVETDEQVDADEIPDSDMKSDTNEEQGVDESINEGFNSGTDTTEDTSEPIEENNDMDIDDITETTDEDTTGSVTDEQASQITFTIIKGMSSRQVSELLVQKGLIKDALDFDNYIKRQGKASVIRIGTYTLPKDADYQTILKAIAG